MSWEEADTYIQKIENEENIPICNAVIGRIDKEDLSDNAREVYEEFQLWSNRRTQRIREEQWTARKRQQETAMGIRMSQLHEQGIITDEVMALYGISGDLPERRMYVGLSIEEKQSLWEERMENRLGPNWRDRFSNGVNNLCFFTNKKIEYIKTNWTKFGF
jgi:hypothetical protein